MDESSRDFTPHARTGVRRVPWKTVLAGAGGALTVGALGAAGLAPLLAGLGVGAPAAASAVVAWLTGMGMNALAGWVGDLAAEGLRAPFAADEPPDPAWLAEVGRRLDAAAAADATLAAELARLLMTIDAVSQSLAALAEELGAQSDVILEQYALLKKISADIPLDVLRRSESIELLRKHRPGLSDADKLAQELGDLPLALHLAGRFLAGIGRNVPVARYLEELRSPRLFERLPLREQDGRLPTGHNRDVARTFALSYERLNPQDAGDGLALQLLARAAHLVPGEVVPADLLRATLEQPDDDLDAQLASEAALDRVVGLGLIEREGEDGLRMHRLVGAYVRQVSADATAQAAVERVVGDVAGNLADAPTLAPIAAFLPLLRGVTDTALGREDVVAATLCIWLGRHLDRLGLYATAQPYLERALAIREGVLGPEHPATAASLNNLAGLLARQGNYAAARPLYERALAIREGVLGPEHPDTATSLNNLALLLASQGDYAAAEQLMIRAVRICEDRLGPDHPDTQASRQSLATIQQRLGRTAPPPSGGAS